MIILLTCKPAISPASFVACLCESLKYAGTVITASVTSCPKYSSAVFFIFCRIIALISGGEYNLSSIFTRAVSLSPFTTSYGTSEISVPTSFILLPINLFIEKTVLVGFVTACRLAGCPTNLSPFFANPTIEGVVLPPSEFGITTGSLPSITETHEFVVPKSIPIILPILFSPFLRSSRLMPLNYLF